MLIIRIVTSNLLKLVEPDAEADNKGNKIYILRVENPNVVVKVIFSA